MRIRHIVLLASALIVAGMPASHAYVLNGPKWGVASVPYYINPVNNDVSQAAAIAAIQAGASSWATQSNANISLSYMGPTSGTSLQNNGKNEVFFRNVANGGLVAETYWWADSSNRLIDADIVFYDGGFTFFTAATGCSSGIYIEGTATHEFGHALGMGHTSVATATMYPTMSWCSNAWQSLDPDDLNGIEALYPGGSANTSPTVAITGPAANSTFTQGTSVTVTGAASDQQDGTISSRINWFSSLDGSLGTGSSRTWTPNAGTHVITATVTDNNGAAASTQETVFVNAVTAPPPPPPPPPPPASGIGLTASGFKTKGVQQAALQWSGATSASIDVFRNNVLVLTTANDGSQTDPINRKGSGSYTYKVCESGTTTCSNLVNVVF
jgi:hypothetical protein